MHQSVCSLRAISVGWMIARNNKMKIVILSIVTCVITAVDADGGSQHIYGSNQVQYQPQPTNYHYPQPHYGSQQPNYPAGFHPAQQPPPQQHNQFSEQYLVTAIKHDPAPPVVQYQQPSYKPENPFNGQSYIIEPSYLLKPYRPETTYHAQPYRPHNPAPYPPSYQAPAYPSYQVPTYPVPVYNQAPAYQPYPAPVYQSQGPPTGSSVILVLAGNTIQPTQTYSTTESSVSPSQVQSVVETVVVESVTVKWSDILSADANELGQKYSDNSKKEKKEKDVKESEEKEEDDDEEDDEKPSTSSTKESDSGAKKQDNNGSQEQQNSNSENVTRPISYPIPANLTSKAVWKIPKTVASYVQSADDGPGTKPDESAGDKSGDDSPETPIQNEKVYSTESENEESSSSKSSLTDNTNQVGITTENKESSETTTADQVTKISLQQQGGGGELANNEGRTYHQQSASQDNNNNEESAAVELVNQVALQQEKPKSGSSVYYEQGPTNAGQEEASSSLNEPGAEISQQDVDSEEAAGTETTPVISNQVSYQPQTGNESAEKPDVSKVISETPSVTEEYLSLYPSQPSIYQQGSQKDNNNKLLDESEETSTDAPAVEVSSEKTNPLDRQEPVVAPADKDESKEIVTVSQVPDVNIHETERPAYLAPYKPVVPKIFRPKVESEEVEPPETGFGERIKAFTKFALAIQKATQQQQGIYQQPALADNTEPISLTPSDPYKSEQVLIHPTEENNNTFESVSTTNAQETSSAENDQLLKVHQPVSEYPATEAPLPSTYEASLFYKKPVAPETVAPLQEQQELSTEGPYKFKPLFYAQAVEKFTTPPLSPSIDTTEAPHEPIKYEEPDQSAKTSYEGRIVAEKMSPDQPVQVINAFHQFVYSSGPSTIEIAPPVVSDPSIIQQPVLDRDPMEKTENYATQRIYTASAEIPGDNVASSTPSSYYIPEENPYVSPAYIEEAGLSAEYQKEIAAAAAQKEAEYVPQTSEESQTEIADVYREEAYSTETAAIVNSDPVKVKSTEDISAEVTESYREKSEAVSAIQVKSAEEVGSSEVTDSPYQTISYETVTTSAPKIKTTEEVSAEIVYTPVTESIYQEKTSEIPFLYDTAPAKTKSEEDVSSEVIVPVTDQYETTESYPDVPKYQDQAIIPSAAPPYYEIHASTSEPESATFVLGTMLQVGDSSLESNEKTSLLIQQPDEQLKSNVPYGNVLPGTEHPPPCQTDKSVATGNHFHQFLFNPASLANVPLDSGESSDEDASTIAPTTLVPDLNNPSTATYNESTSAETSTVASDGGYKYVFKSRPTPNRFYESRSTTAIPSTNNSTTSDPPTSRRPFVVIGKPIEMRKPINGRIYSRPLPVPQRKPQTLAQIKILPTRLRSSTSTIQLPNRRFFIGRTLTMTNEKNNRDSKEEETKKEA